MYAEGAFDNIFTRPNFHLSNAARNCLVAERMSVCSLNHTPCILTSINDTVVYVVTVKFTFRLDPLTNKLKLVVANALTPPSK